MKQTIERKGMGRRFGKWFFTPYTDSFSFRAEMTRESMGHSAEYVFGLPAIIGRGLRMRSVRINPEYEARERGLSLEDHTIDMIDRHIKFNVFKVAISIFLFSSFLSVYTDFIHGHVSFRTYCGVMSTLCLGLLFWGTCLHQMYLRNSVALNFVYGSMKLLKHPTEIVWPFHSFNDTYENLYGEDIMTGKKIRRKNNEQAKQIRSEKKTK